MGLEVGSCVTINIMRTRRCGFVDCSLAALGEILWTHEYTSVVWWCVHKTSDSRAGVDGHPHRFANLGFLHFFLLVGIQLCEVMARNSRLAALA